MPKRSFFFSIARRNRTKPPSQAGVGFKLGSVSHGWFYLSYITHELKLRRNQGPTSWGVLSADWAKPLEPPVAS